MSIKSVRQAMLAALLALPLPTAALAAGETLTAVVNAPLRVLDPITTTAGVTRNHGYMIFDTLLGTDEKFAVQPQMAEKWTKSEDGKTYTFTLRPGLKWHDGKPVTAEDCIASIKRWSEQNKMGQTIAALTVEMKALDERSFQISLKQPTNLLLEGLASISGIPPFMMPKRLAETPSTQQIKEQIGSGPFRFVAAEFQPGIKAVYERNNDYVPRSEPASWSAGGKVVNVDRVEWVAMPDALTAVNAMINGEVDYIEQVSYDLLPMLEGKKDVTVATLDGVGSQTVFRFNHLHPPFDNKLVRQAAIHAVAQEDVLKALVGNPKYYQTCAAVFGCGTPYESAARKDMVIPANIEKAKALLKEAKYDGTPVVILQPTDSATLSPQPLVIAQALRRAGFTVDLQAMDWQSVVTRRANQGEPSKGGWSLLSTYITLVDITDPVRNYVVVSNGKKAWFGWPYVPAIEDLRAKFIASSDPAELKALASQIHDAALDEGVIVPIGQFQVPSAYRKSLTNVMNSPVPFFWNVKKAGR